MPRLFPPLLASLLAASVAAAAPIERVVHISVDGLNVPVLADLIANDPAEVPAFARLIAEGAHTWNTRTDYDYTITVPNHVSMLTGRPILQPDGQPNTVHHGIETNGPGPTDTIHNIGNENLPYIPSAFDVVHDRGFGTAFYASKTRLAAFLERSYNAQNGAIDVIAPNNGRDKIDAYANFEGESEETIPAFITAMNATPRMYSFVHIVDPDYAGHADGWDSPEYRDAVITTDARIKTILDYVSTDPDFAGKTAVIVTADHGGTEENHVDEVVPGNYTIPFFMWGPGIPQANAYALFSNRHDPGDTRPDYNVPQQPLRNGDTGNIALALLGLPSVPGSTLTPILSLPPVAMPGDINTSGKVDAHDAALFVTRFGSAGGGWETGDFNLDGRTNIADLALLQAHFSTVPTSPEASPVCEPSTAILGLAALATGAMRRRLRRIHRS